eukprot:14798-Heterococcus_DN1.PRE.1
MEAGSVTAAAAAAAAAAASSTAASDDTAQQRRGYSLIDGPRLVAKRSRANMDDESEAEPLAKKGSAGALLLQLPDAAAELAAAAAVGGAVVPAPANAPLVSPLYSAVPCSSRGGTFAPTVEDSDAAKPQQPVLEPMLWGVATESGDGAAGSDSSKLRDVDFCSRTRSALLVGAARGASYCHVPVHTLSITDIAALAPLPAS